MGKYVMILGAGLMQRPSIEAAMDLGYRTLVTDANPGALCASFADVFEPVDLKDKEGLLSLAKSFGGELAGVFTAGTDFSASVSYVAEGCSLPSHTYQAAMNASNKALMRACFKSAGIPSPGYTRIFRSELASFMESHPLESLPYPLVIKPVDNMGARGCRLVRTKEEFIPAAEDAMRASLSSCAILEEYMSGPEFSIDAIIYKGTFTVTGFADRHIFYEPYFIEMGHTIPTCADSGIRNELIATFARAAHSLGLTCGAAKADIKYTASGPMVGEIAARLSGGYMSGWTFPYSSGIDLTSQAVLVATGNEPHELLLRRQPLPISGVPFPVYELPSIRHSAERALISIPGTVREIHGEERATAYPYVRNYFPRVKPASRVDFPRNNVEKCGNIITFAASGSLASESAEKSVSQIVLRLEPCDEATKNFLSGIQGRAEKDFPPDAYSAAREVTDYLMAADGSLGRDQKAASLLKDAPDYVSEWAKSARDWNHRTPMESLSLFDSICPVHPPVPLGDFWRALIRGGVQGILYTADSLREGGD